MSNINDFRSDIERRLAEEQKRYDDAVNEKIIYGELKEDAAKREKSAKAAIKDLETAKMHADKLAESYTSDVVIIEKEKTENTAETSEKIFTTEETEDKEDVVVIEERTTNKKKGSGIKGFVIGAAAVCLLIGGWKLYKECKAGSIKGNSRPLVGASVLDDTKETPAPQLTDNGDINYNQENNEVTVIVDNTTEDNSAVVVIADDNQDAQEELTNENFEDLVANYANKYSDQYTSVTTADIAKFAVITNIDLLAEQNPELISQIANGQTKEEFLNDAAKLVGATVMNNFTVWNNTHSTQDFIRVSDIVYGSQREQMLKIENYVERIADAVNQGDKDLVNKLVHEFLVDMNSGELSKLDDGVGFAAQVNIAMIADGIARDYLNKENFDMLQVLKTSEKYVSNIFTEYDKCNEAGKTRTK